MRFFAPMLLSLFMQASNSFLHLVIQFAVTTSRVRVPQLRLRAGFPAGQGMHRV